MPGYIMNLNSRASLENYIHKGAYGTIMERPKRGYWSNAAEMTLADYVTMRTGDLVFFFLKRAIYGVGRLVSFQSEGEELVALSNFPGSSDPTIEPPSDLSQYLWRENGEENIRWVVFFQHSPCFFSRGLDMDEVLEADTKRVVHSLRAFERRSFVQVDDEEAQVILDLLVRRNEDVLDDMAAHGDRVFRDESASVHQRVEATNLPEHRLQVDDLIHRYATEGQVRHEALIQAWLAENLARRSPCVRCIFGDWDYIANQVPASPQKPVRYMDRIDIFGHVRRRLAPDLASTIVRFKVVEVKKDLVSSAETVDQLMKYVDWTAHTRCGGDYAMIDAYLVAHQFSDDVRQYADREATRRYVIPRRPYQAQRWSGLRFVRYEHNDAVPALRLSVL